MGVSVAMGTYNGARFLGEQLNSLAAQTVLPAELLVSDDNSTDATLDIVRAFAATAPFPVRILDKAERLGFADNFLNAAAHCRHDIVAFCDQDDVWLPHKLEVGLRRLLDDDSLLSMHRLTVTDEALQPVATWDQDIEADGVFEPLALDPYITGWGNSMMFRRELATLIPRERRPRQPESPDRPLSHDTWIYVLAAALGRVSHIREPLILYRQHGRNTEGLTVRPKLFRHRLLAWSRVPMTRIKEQCLFDERMAALFDQLARTPGGFAEPARRAAAAFGMRRDVLATRIRLHDAARLSERLDAYRRLQRMPRDVPPWLGSRAKEFVLGVLGVATALNRKAGS